MKGKSMTAALGAIGVGAALLLALSTLLSPVARRNAQAEQTEMMARLLPGSTTFTPEGVDSGDEFVFAAYKGEGGYVVETITHGYAGDIRLLVGVSDGGEVTGVVVRDLEETPGLGLGALGDVEFLSQFLHTSGQAAVGESVDSLTGATVTSKAITKGVNAAVAFVTGADISSAATEWEG